MAWLAANGDARRVPFWAAWSMRVGTGLQISVLASQWTLGDDWKGGVGLELTVYRGPQTVALRMAGRETLPSGNIVLPKDTLLV